MNREEFINYIELIGFKPYNYLSHMYKEFIIDLYRDYYDFYNGSEWIFYDYNDLTPLENYFKNELRSYKLKQLLR